MQGDKSRVDAVERIIIFLIQAVEPSPQVSGLVFLGWVMRAHISNRFPGEADAAGPGNTV